MLQSIYLHKEIVNVLRSFGDLDIVVNQILAYGAEGYYEVTDKPPAPPRDMAGRYTISITDENYLQLLEIYPVNSPKISIRRLLYWFVENEMYDELGWKINTYCNKNNDDTLNNIKNIIRSITELASVMEDKYKPYTDKAINELKSLEEQLHGLQYFDENVI
jgi:hypothetical protein